MDIAGAVRGTGYVLRPAEDVALRATFARRNGARVLILEGPPGTGKTALGRAVAQAQGAVEVYYLCHHWSSEEDLFIGVDVGRVAAGVERPEDAYRPGALLRAVEASQGGPAVLIVDELDKAPQRMEALLLEFLQTGTVHGPRGERWQADLDRLVVFLTSNGVRPLLEPTLRRGMRVRLGFLPPQEEANLLRRRTGARPGVIAAAVAAANAIRSKGASSPSLQEIAHLLEDMRVTSTAAEVAVLVEGWLVKEDEDRAALPGGVQGLAAVLHGERSR